MTIPIIEFDQAYNRNGDRKLQRTVVNAIRTYVDNHTLVGWVKAETLSRDTGIGLRTVREQIAANVAAGWLEIVESGNSSGKANIYRLINRAAERTVSIEPETGKGAPQLTIGAGEGCAPAHGKGALQRTPTTPRTSPQREVLERTTPEEGALQRTLPDPWGSGVSHLPATETATESNRAPQRTLREPCATAHPRPTTFGSGCPANPFCDEPQPCDCRLPVIAARPREETSRDHLPAT